MAKRTAKRMAKFQHDPVKKTILGAFVFLLGLVWYLVEAGVLLIDQFWPKIMMLVGVLIMLKGIWISCFKS